MYEQSCLLVWDNFESVSGVIGTKISPLLPEEDRQQLKGFLEQLRLGSSKMLLTSRSAEKWLGIKTCYELPILSSLQGEECWEYCNRVVTDLGLHISPKDKTYRDLINHGETVLNDSVQILAYHFSRIISHSQVIKYSSYIASEFFDC